MNNKTYYGEEGSYEQYIDREGNPTIGEKNAIIYRINNGKKYFLDFSSDYIDSNYIRLEYIQSNGNEEKYFFPDCGPMCIKIDLRTNPEKIDD
jgi:hypothetical protein